MDPTRTLTLTDFLLARIAEDEAVAQAASTLPMRNPAEMDEWTQVPGEPAEWVSGDGYGSGAVERTNGDPHEVGIVVYDEGSPSESEAAHIARHDPARVLAECEAKRQIVEDWQSLADRLDDQGRPLHLFDPITSMLLKVTEPWIRALALPYADHPDYRGEWKP